MKRLLFAAAVAAGVFVPAAAHAHTSNPVYETVCAVDDREVVTVSFDNDVDLAATVTIGAVEVLLPASGIVTVVVDHEPELPYVVEWEDGFVEQGTLTPETGFEGCVEVLPPAPCGPNGPVLLDVCPPQTYPPTTVTYPDWVVTTLPAEPTVDTPVEVPVVSPPPSPVVDELAFTGPSTFTLVYSTAGVLLIAAGAALIAVARKDRRA